MNESGERYGRQLILPQIGESGQRKLRESRIAVVGMGALGCLSSTLLVRAGIGEISVIDRDVVELDNLHRQLLFQEGDVGEAKAIVAARRLRAMNSTVDVRSFPSDLIPRNVSNILGDADIIVDGLDNMKTRFLINDYCVKHKIPFIYGGAVATYGMTMTIIPEVTPWFQCLFPSLPPPGSVATCDTVGVLNTVPATISSIQAADAIRTILGEAVGGRLLTYDAWSREIDQIEISRNEGCPSCGKGEFHYLEEDADLVVSLCGRSAVSISPFREQRVDFDSLEGRLRKVGEVRRREGILAFTIQTYRMTIFSDGRVLVSGTGDISKARTLYSKFIGE